ncbi:MAG: peptidase domain-containing ABC transporter [Gammaproteobacteria bacterium]
MVFQAETNECGLACLAMVAGFHGLVTDLNALRSKMGAAALGTSARQILELARRLKIRGRALKVELEDLPNLALPAILHWDLDHYVVLKRVSDRSIVIHDPAVGVRKYTREELAHHFTGIAVEFYPQKNFKPAKNEASLKLADLLSTVPLTAGSLALVFVMTLLLQVLAVLNPLYLQLVIDQGLVKGDRDLILMLAMLFVLLLLVRTLVSHMRGIHLLHFGNQIGFQLVSGVAHHLSSLPLSYFERREMGDIVSRFGSLENIRRLVTQEMVTILVDGLFSLITLLLLFLYSPLLGAIVLLSVLFFVVLRLLSISRERDLRREALVTSAKQQTRFMENIRSVSVAKVNAVESLRHNEWEKSFTEQLNSGFRLDSLQLGLGTAQSLIFGLENIVTIYLGASAVSGGSFSIGQLMSFILLKQHFIGSVTAMLPKLSDIRMLNLELERVSDVVQPGAIDNQDEDRLLPLPNGGDIELIDLDFDYEGSGTPLISKLNFRFRNGQCTAIVGSSGCGKSTLLKLILGLEQAQQGSITVGGKESRLVQASALRSKLSAVLHGDGLLSGDLAYNIHLGVGSVDWNRLTELSEKLGFAELVEQLPLGYSTEVGELGSVLSAGQVQRILLARALYRNPDFLLLDEALSNLNTQAAIPILDYIKSRNITLLMVTHNPDLLEHMDSVLSLS